MTQLTTLENLLAEIDAEGFHIDMIHQNNAGYWQGSLRPKDEACATYPVYGDSLYSALAHAFELIRNGVGRRVTSHVNIYTGPFKVDPDAKLSKSVTEALANLLPKSEPIKRRI